MSSKNALLVRLNAHLACTYLQIYHGKANYPPQNWFTVYQCWAVIRKNEETLVVTWVVLQFITMNLKKSNYWF
jgi:hypothetical protein